MTGFVLIAHLAGCSDDDRTNIFALCGNGILNPGEQCDDGRANSDTGDCLTTCVKAVCGDFFVDRSMNKEQCDGTNFLFNTCSSIGFSGGTLQCTSSCQYDTAKCGLASTPRPTATPAPTSTPTPRSGVIVTRKYRRWTLPQALARLHCGDDGADLESRPFQRGHDVVDSPPTEVQV